MSTKLTISEVLSNFVARRDLTTAQIGAVFRAIILGEWGEPEAAAFLIALRMKGESANEIAAAAKVLREHMVRIQSKHTSVLDTCGTGGDGAGTFNISTAAALVAAACGIPVVKHGNRSVSSRCGSADVLATLGVTIDCPPPTAQRCLDECGLAFCFAPLFHPALKNVSQLRRRLGIPTIFNSLGPLANPAGAQHQLLGVGRRELLDLMAEALAVLGTRHSLVVWSEDGLDEASLSAVTHVRRVRNHEVSAETWTAQDFGLERCDLNDLKAEDAQQSAAIIAAVLDGQDGPARRIVLANAAAALVAVERVTSLQEGVACAAQAIATGRAKSLLERLRQCSKVVSGS